MLGSYSEEVCREWVPSDHFFGDVASSDVSDHPDVWTDGSFVLDEFSGVGVGGRGVYSLKTGAGWFDRRWGHLELLPPSELGVERCVLYDSVRGPLQSVQRAELWELSLLYNAPLPFIWELTILMLFVMFLGFWRSCCL